jgi:hypothetical protein
MTLQTPEIIEQCGQPLYKVGETHYFKLRVLSTDVEGFDGHIEGEGVIEDCEPDPDFCTWSYLICGYWLEQSIIENSEFWYQAEKEECNA